MLCYDMLKLCLFKWSTYTTALQILRGTVVVHHVVWIFPFFSKQKGTEHGHLLRTKIETEKEECYSYVLQILEDKSSSLIAHKYPLSLPNGVWAKLILNLSNACSNLHNCKYLFILIFYHLKVRKHQYHTEETAN